MATQVTDVREDHGAVYRSFLFVKLLTLLKKKLMSSIFLFCLIFTYSNKVGKC